MDQNVLTSSSVTFGGLTLSNLAGGGTQCLQVNNSGVLSATGSGCGTSGGGISSLTLAGTSGSSQTLADGDTITIAAGNGVTTTGSATDTVTVALDQSAALTGDHSLSANGSKFGVNGLIFEGATADTFETYITLTDPTADRTITFPNASITVNAAGDISGTTLASNVVTTSITTVGALNAGSITSGFGAIDIGADNFTTTGVVNTDTLTLTNTGTLNGLDAIDVTTESTLEGAIDIAGDVTGTGLTGVDLDEVAVETELESVIDLSDLQGAITDAQVPNNITIDLATLASTVTVVDSTDATSFVAIFDSATGALATKTDGGLTYDATTGTLSPTILSTTTLNSVTTIDATTESTIESAIDIAGDVTGTGLGAVTISANAVALGTDTTGNYILDIVAGAGLTGDTAGEGATATLAIGAGTGITVNANDVAITADAVGDTQLAFNTGQHLTTTSSVAFNDVTLTNTGLHILDTNASHDLIIAPGSNLTADRTFTIATGDADRTLTLAGDATISGTNTGDQTSVTGNAGTVTFADAGGDTTTFIALGTDATGALSPSTDAGLTYNATTNALTATTFIGALTGDVTGNVSGSSGSTTGNAATATALASNPSDCSANTFATTIAANGNLTCTSIADADVPNNITIDLATLASSVTNATLTTALTVNTGTVTLTGNVANNSVLTLGAGASSISGSNTGDQTITLTGDVTGSGTGSFATTIASNSVALTTDTTGDYVASFTAGAGLTGSASGEGSTPTLAVVSNNGAIVVNTDDIALTLAASADGLSSSTSSGSGMEVLSSGLALLQGCANNEVLKWNETSDVWACGTAGGGAVSADSLDFIDLEDSLDLDAATDINLGANALTIDMDSTGDFSVRDGTTDIALFDDTGGITFSPTGTSDVTITTDDDTSLIINNGALTNDGQAIDINITLGGDADVDTVAGLNIDVTSAATGDADVLSGINIGALSSADADVIERGLTIGTGWDEAIRANGDITIAAQADATAHNYASGCNCSLNSAAGTFGSQTAIDRVNDFVVYKGKLFAATSETDTAGVYRYDGGTTWTLVTNAAGKAVSGDNTNIDAYVLGVHNGRLYIGSQTGASEGALYYSTTADTTADSFTMFNATRGTFASPNQDGVYDIISFMGFLTVSTMEPDAAEIVRYSGTTDGWQQLNPTDGKSNGETTHDKDGFNLAVWKDYILMGGVTGSTTAMLSYSQGANGSVTSISTTAGNVNGFEGSVEQVSSIVSFGGTYYYSTGKTNSSSINVARVSVTGSNTATYTTRANETSNSGKIISADTANVDASILGVYNGRLYAGSVTGAGTAAIYELVGKQDWELVNTTRGTFGGETGIDGISAMIEYNGQMFIGTDDGANGVASVYSWSKTSANSYGLKFDSGSSNFGKISFNLDNQATSQSQSGTFNFSHSVNMKSNAFDYAEDYPTYDTSLKPGDLVMIDPDNVDFVKRADGSNPAIGIYSLNPGLRLQKSKDTPDMGGEAWIPIALVGRVPVKVSTENGIIMPGDSLMLSHTLPGVAMKATKSGAIIAQALQGYSGSDVGEISVFINNSYGSGSSFDKILNPVETVDANGITVVNNPTYSANALLEQLVADKDLLINSTNLSDIFADRIAAGLEIVTPTLVADTVKTNTLSSSTGKDINVILSADGTFTIGENTVIDNPDGTTTISVPVVEFDAQGNANFAGKLKAESIEAGSITGMDAIVNKITLLSNGQEALTLTATAVDALNQALVAIGADISDIQIKLNDVQSAILDLNDKQKKLEDVDAGFEIRIKAIEDLLASNALTQTSIVNGDSLNINGDSVLNGKTIFGSQVVFNTPPIFNQDTAGFAVVKAGSKKVDIVFNNSYIAQPIVNTSISFEDNDDITKNMTDAEADEFFNQDIKFVITNKTQNGFSIRVNKTLNQDIKFSWTALQVQDPKVFESVIPGLIIDPPQIIVEPDPVVTDQTVDEVVDTDSSSVSSSTTDSEPTVEITPNPDPVVLPEDLEPTVVDPVVTTTPEPIVEPAPEPIAEPAPIVEPAPTE